MGSKAFHLKDGEEPEMMGINKVSMCKSIKEAWEEEHLSSGFLWQNPKPVSNHGQNGCKVGQTQQDPEPDQRFIPVVIPIFPRTFERIQRACG